jgi:hypothetical protein
MFPASCAQNFAGAVEQDAINQGEIVAHGRWQS